MDVARQLIKEELALKFVLIGGGSFVFAPTVLEDIIVKHRLANDELVLLDLNAEAVESMSGAGQRIAKELGCPSKFLPLPIAGLRCLVQTM